MEEHKYKCPYCSHEADSVIKLTNHLGLCERRKKLISLEQEKK
jgi:hypothetical protein